MSAPPRLLLVLPDLEPGGMQTRFLTTARAAAARGIGVTLLSGDGPLRREAAAAAELRLIDWSGPHAATLEAACDAAHGHTAAVVALDPGNVHVLPGLAARTALHVCVHNLPGTFRGWWAPAALDRLPELLAALHAHAPASLSAPSERVARVHERDLELAAGTIGAWPSGVDVPGTPPPAPRGPIRSVTVICRLAAEKAPILAAAAELLAAGRALGSDAELHVHGAGPDAGPLRDLLAERLPDGGWHLHGATADALAVLREADVVVATGRAALEAVACQRRVAVSRAYGHADGHLGPPVTAGNLEELAGLTMSWADRPPLHAGDVWRALDATGAYASAAAGEAVRSRHSGGASLDGLLALIDAAQRREPDPWSLTEAIAAHAAALADELSELQRVADELWQAREDHLRARSTAPTVSPNAT
jgi:hypothetical protein